MGAVAGTRVIKYNDKRIINKKPGLLTALSWDKSPTRKKATRRKKSGKAPPLMSSDAPIQIQPLVPTTHLKPKSSFSKPLNPHHSGWTFLDHIPDHLCYLWN